MILLYHTRKAMTPTEEQRCDNIIQETSFTFAKMIAVRTADRATKPILTNSKNAHDAAKKPN